jgi:hypothetical protein
VIFESYSPSNARYREIDEAAKPVLQEPKSCLGVLDWKGE